MPKAPPMTAFQAQRVDTYALKAAELRKQRTEVRRQLKEVTERGKPRLEAVLRAIERQLAWYSARVIGAEGRKVLKARP